MIKVGFLGTFAPIRHDVNVTTNINLVCHVDLTTLFAS
jgi:hypothetical protein